VHGKASNGDNRGFNDSVCRHVARGSVNQYIYVTLLFSSLSRSPMDLQQLSAACLSLCKSNNPVAGAEYIFLSSYTQRPRISESRARHLACFDLQDLTEVWSVFCLPAIVHQRIRSRLGYRRGPQSVRPTTGALSSSQPESDAMKSHSKLTST